MDFLYKEFLVLINIIVIDLVLSGDNAIIIGMATKDLPANLRKKAIVRWTLAATVLRIILSSVAVFLLQVVWLKLVWWLLLLYVVWKFYSQLRLGDDGWTHTKTAASLWQAIWVIVIADISLSLDNVLAVAGAAHGNIILLWIGLVFSIIMMAFASNMIAKLLNRIPIIQWIWLLVILGAALSMILGGSDEISGIFKIPGLLPFIMVWVGTLFVVIHQLAVRKEAENKFRLWMSNNYLSVITVLLISVATLLIGGEYLVWYLWTHKELLYTIITIILFLALEMVALKVYKK